MKCLTKKQHIEAKEHWMASLNLEKAHKLAIAGLPKEHNVAIDNAFGTTDIKTNQRIMLEQQRLEAEAGYTARTREECQLANEKLEKGRRSHKAISLDWHAC